MALLIVWMHGRLGDAKRSLSRHCAPHCHLAAAVIAATVVVPLHLLLLPLVALLLVVMPLLLLLPALLLRCHCTALLLLRHLPSKLQPLAASHWMPLARCPSSHTLLTMPRLAPAG